MYMKQLLRKYGIKSTVTFKKSRSMLRNRENDMKMSLFAHIQLEFAIIDS